MRRLTALLVALPFLASACSERSEPPTYWRIVELHGSPYERGFQHGRLLGDEIRSLYTTLLGTSILPFLNRERRDVSSVLAQYKDDEIYGPDERGIDKFSYQIQLESGRNLQALIEDEYPEYFDELRGISDGSGVEYDKILILNTFVDTMLAFRGITFYIRQIQGPLLGQVELISPAINRDGVDNNGDGAIDDGKDGLVRDWRRADSGWEWVDEYGPRPSASFVELPTDVAIRLLLEDQFPLANSSLLPEVPQEPQTMNPFSIRVRLGDALYQPQGCDERCRRCDEAPAGLECSCEPPFRIRCAGDEGQSLEVLFTPPAQLQAARTGSFTIQAGNSSRIEWPTPTHARNMREERITYTTRGAGKSLQEVSNREEGGSRSQPPALGFGVRGDATWDGALRLAHNFALLDANAAHKHTVLFVHRPDDGKDHAVVAWAGTIAGFSGMNEDGLTYLINTADTLDNAMTKQVDRDSLEARMVSEGVPVFMMGRRMLERMTTVAEAQQYLEFDVDATFGWNLLLGDAGRDLAAVELDTNLDRELNRGYFSFAPGEGIGSTGPHDLRIGSHFQKNSQDIDKDFWMVKSIWIQPQRYWSTFWPRAVQAHAVLGEEIERYHGFIGTREMKDILRVRELHDARDGMNSVVFEPECRRLHFAMGQVPTTDGPFIPFELVPGRCAP